MEAELDKSPEGIATALEYIDDHEPSHSKEYCDALLTVPPLELWFEMGPYCNKKCGHCYNEYGPDREGFMTPDIVQLAMEQLPDTMIQKVALTDGEPFHNSENLMEILDAIDGFPTNIVTNAYFATSYSRAKAMLEELREHCFSVLPQETSLPRGKRGSLLIASASEYHGDDSYERVQHLARAYLDVFADEYQARGFKFHLKPAFHVMHVKKHRLQPPVDDSLSAQLRYAKNDVRVAAAVIKRRLKSEFVEFKDRGLVDRVSHWAERIAEEGAKFIDEVRDDPRLFKRSIPDNLWWYGLNISEQLVEMVTTDADKVAIHDRDLIKRLLKPLRDSIPGVVGSVMCNEERSHTYLSCERGAIRVQDGVIRPLGRAREILKPKKRKVTPAMLAFEPEDTADVSLDHQGNLYFGQNMCRAPGRLLGNIKERPLADMLDELQRDPVYRAMRVAGVAGIFNSMKKQGLGKDWEAESKCDFCKQVFSDTELLDKYREAMLEN